MKQKSQLYALRFSFLLFHKLPLGFPDFAMRVLLFYKNGSAHDSEKNIDIKPAE
jgi:hypothetical protein